MENTEIKNRVQNASLAVFDLEDLYVSGERMPFDMAQVLYMGLILREKELNEFLKAHDWSAYADAHVYIFCSSDAIIPVWAYMRVQAEVLKYARTAIFGTKEELETLIFDKVLGSHDFSIYQDKKVIIKGCSKKEVPVTVYTRAFAELQKYAKLIAFGEACSNVPIWKKTARSTQNEDRNA
jgi:hypothetical protein